METKNIMTHCDVSGAQGLRCLKCCTLVGGMTFVHPRFRGLWWCEVCPPQIAMLVGVYTTQPCPRNPHR